MEKILIVALALLFYSCFAKCQTVAERESCDFLKNLIFKNGTDTIFIKVTITEIGRWPSGADIMKKLEKEGKLREKDFSYAIGFIPNNCNNEYYTASKDTGEVALSLFKPERTGTQILLTCIVFENYKMRDYPFFVIDKVQLK
jgi:hypothetical protein